MNGLNLALGPGMYWFTVVPEAPGQQGRSSNTNTFGQNSIGTEIPDEQYINSPFFDYNFTNADNLSIFPGFSSGVIGTAIPEPASMVMLATGLIAVAGVARRRHL